MSRIRLNFSEAQLLAAIGTRLILVALTFLICNCTQVALATTQSQTEPPAVNRIPVDSPRPTNSESPSAESQLVEGLLDLMEVEPQSQEPEQELQDPIVVVQQLMYEASDLLLNGNSTQKASQLQRSVLDQLDTLIRQLQQSQPDASPNSNSSNTAQDQDVRKQESTSQNGKTSESITRQQSDQTQSKESDPSSNNENKESTFGNDQSEGAGQGQGNQSGAAGLGTSSAVRLNNSNDLQQSVWGHLPENVRSQMQSRMVEEFLPSYRQHLEAYYRSLLNREPKR